MLNEFLIIFAGILIILALGGVIVRHAIEIAQYYNLSGTFIGLSVLSVGTSLPEIMTHIVGSVIILSDPAQLDTLSSLLVGTNVGSDIFQQNFLLPVVGIIGTVVVIKERLVAVIGTLAGASILVWLFMLGGIITRLEGTILVIAYVAYLIYIARNKAFQNHSPIPALTRKHPIGISLILIVLCFAIMSVVTIEIVGAANILIQLLPISASFFGVIFLGIASAMPELVTSLISILKDQRGISAGILIGSNITNPLLGIGLGAMISTYTIPAVVIIYDLPVKIATAILLYIFLTYREDLNKVEATILLALFFAYVFVRQIYFPEDIMTI